MQISAVEATELFVGDPDAPLQIVRVGYTDAPSGAEVRIDGEGLSTPEPVAVPVGEGTVEVAVRVADPVPGRRRAARAVAGETAGVEFASEFAFEFEDAEPGWTMHMISHFHYDPVWWNTQGAYTSVWTEDGSSNLTGQCLFRDVGVSLT
ncbi:MAG: hypothetical protein E6Q56_00135 [Mycobacterium sp.]|nr:MAG: hypothetical protein E6Q56_00135 [Mycobacterium sp.]